MTEDTTPLTGHRQPVVSSLATMVVNEFMSRTSFNQRLYDGAYKSRDIDAECGYPEGLTMGDFLAMYRRNDIAARVNDIEPNSCWEQYPSVEETEQERETEFEKAIDTLVAETNLYSYLARADRISGIGRYGVLFVGFDDGEDFDTPAPGFNEMAPETTPGQAKVLYYRVFDESGVSIAEYDTDKKSKRRGLPKYYTLTFEDGDTSTSSLKVHWSRVVHIADNLTSSLVFGTPRMENVFNRLYDLRKISGGAAEMFWKGGFPGLSFEVDPKHGEFSEDDKAALKAETKAYSEGLMRYITTVGVSVKSIAPQIANPDAHINSCLKIIAITKGIPMQQFLGTTAGNQDGAADVKTWGERVALRRNMYITPHIIRPLIDKLIQAGAVPKPADGYTVKWKPLATLTEVERAQVGKDLTEALARYSTAGAEALVPLPEFLGKFLGFSYQQVEAIVKAPATKLSVVLQELAMGMTGSGNGNMPSSIPAMGKKKDPSKTPVNMVQRAKPKATKNTQSATTPPATQK